MGADSTRAPDGATTFTTKNDDQIVAAWRRYATARATMSVLPHAPCPPGKATTPAEDEQTDIMDAAEAVIRDGLASTVRGVEIKLWLMLHDHADNEPSALMAVREDLKWCDEDGSYNGFDRHIIPALRSIRAMVERPARDDFAKLLQAWNDARGARDAFDKANRPKDATGLTPEMAAFEESLSPFHDACLATANAVINCPAPDAAAVLQKQRVFYAEEMHTCQDTAADVTEAIFADAVRLAGGVA